MKAFIVCLCLALAAAAVSAADSRRILEKEAILKSHGDAYSYNGRAGVELYGHSKGGELKLTGAAKAKAIEYARSEYKKIFLYIKKNYGYKYFKGHKTIFARACAEAVAESWSLAHSRVESTGHHNSGCVKAYASAYAAAEAYAYAHIDIFLHVYNFRSSAKSRGIAKKLAKASVSAFTKALAGACHYGRGRTEAYKADYAYAFERVYADAYVWIFAELLPYYAKVRAHGKVDESSYSDVGVKSKGGTESHSLDNGSHGHGFTRGFGQATAGSPLDLKCEDFPRARTCCRPANGYEPRCNAKPAGYQKYTKLKMFYVGHGRKCVCYP